MQADKPVRFFAAEAFGLYAYFFEDLSNHSYTVEQSKTAARKEAKQAGQAATSSALGANGQATKRME